MKYKIKAEMLVEAKDLKELFTAIAQYASDLANGNETSIHFTGFIEVYESHDMFIVYRPGDMNVT